MLRKEIQSLVDTKVLQSFVMTYHVKERGSSFHLCLEIPTLADYSLKALEDTNHMNGILDIVQPYLSRQESSVSDYFKEIVDGQTEILSQLTVATIGTTTEVLATRLIENASRGCKAALDILNNDLSMNLKPIMLYDLIFEKCNPLNSGLWISDTAHFCFNSLGMNLIEEYAIQGYPVFSSSDKMVQTTSRAVERLLNRGVSSA
jgi:hypothetical protein